MAGGTNAIRSAVIGIQPSMVEGRAQPGCGRVAERTRRGEPRSNVVGAISCLVIRLVAAKTIGRQGGVIGVYMTTRARDLCVSARPWEARVVLLKLAGDHAAVLWQASHCCGKPPATWFGL